MATNKILIIVTNAGEYHKVGMRTGLWLGELTHFYDYVTEHGFAVDIASPSGGYVPIDPESLAHEVLGELGTDQRYADREFMNLLENTKKASEVNVEDYDAIYFTGGHGVMFDFGGKDLGAVTARFYETDRIVSAVCHGPAGLLNVPLSNGEPLIKGKNIDWLLLARRGSSTTRRRRPVQPAGGVEKLGANYSIADKPFDTYVVEDGRLITGQNPGSARSVAEAVVAKLQS